MKIILGVQPLSDLNANKTKAQQFKNYRKYLRSHTYINIYIYMRLDLVFPECCAEGFPF